MSDPLLSEWRRFQGDTILKGQFEGLAPRDGLAQNRVINQRFGLAA
jgi:hypothetical protein